MTVNEWEKLYLDDLSVGQTFESDPVTVVHESMLAFAREFDPQPFHLAPAEAEMSLFRGLAASGWNTATLTMEMLVVSVPLGNGIIGLGIELAWPTPTYPDDVLHLNCTVLAIDHSASKADRGVVTMLMETRNQYDKVVQRATGKLLVFQRPAED
ncbi:dehydratase [Pseudomonas glycinae]|uniref:MaoC/PaaZ C-terminal domain-containing protein n=1 Tax=Pseudomonas glycinae TaxID=1785145 RepID=UPI0018D90EE5|nr:MaoC/PaaZ C-terminal domain-containing protein [Pseudomonas glycinae]MBH3404722.1 dehydratase [Pseudomonas glycinae]